MSDRPCHRVRTATATAAAILIALPLAACSADHDATPADSDMSTAPADSPDAPTDPADTGSTEGDKASDDDGTADAPATLFDAIDLAEREAGGTAFEVDRDRDQGDEVWEISIAAGTDEVELVVSSDGSEVLRSRPDGSLSTDVSEGLDAATVRVVDAIRVALAEVGGTFDEIDLERLGDGYGYAWQVGVAHEGGGTTDVYVDAVTGAVVKVE